MKVGLLPLDERPVNVRYPAMLAEIAGARLSLPPAELLSLQHRPADLAGLADWAEQAARECDALIVSLEMFAYGSLIASRTSQEGPEQVMARLGLLRRLRRQHPSLVLYGFNLITRISNADSAAEEPAYWARYGVQLYRLSQAIDRSLQGQAAPDELARLQAAAPAEHRDDFLLRRLRNHTINLAALHWLAENVFDLLVLSSDDTSPYGLPSREKRWLAEWAGRLPLGERLLMYPGADEVGCVLLARLLNQAAGVEPAFEAAFFPPEDSQVTAAYEDGPIQETLERQARAAGGRLAAGDGAIWVGVNPPFVHREEWSPQRADSDFRERQAARQALVEAARSRLERGERAAVADAAYPNGADPALVAALRQGLDLSRLSAYGAWNTAGNTIGVVLAQACLTPPGLSQEGERARRRFLLHRLVEDWGYQHLARREIRAARPPGVEPGPDEQPAVLARLETRLNGLIDELPGFAGEWRIAPGSLRFPWKRTFEIDFELEFRPGS